MTITCYVLRVGTIALVVRSIGIIRCEGWVYGKGAFRCGLRCTPRLGPVYRRAGCGVQGNEKGRSRLIETERLCDEWDETKYEKQLVHFCNRSGEIPYFIWPLRKGDRCRMESVYFLLCYSLICHVRYAKDLYFCTY